jgi:hypothetical protein
LVVILSSLSSFLSFNSLVSNRLFEAFVGKELVF